MEKKYICSFCDNEYNTREERDACEKQCCEKMEEAEAIETKKSEDEKAAATELEELSRRLDKMEEEYDKLNDEFSAKAVDFFDKYRDVEIECETCERKNHNLTALDLVEQLIDYFHLS